MTTSSERRTSPVELLWDLVFVFAVTQVSTLLSHDLSWGGLGRALLALALVWWAWSAFVWVANAQDPDEPAMRGALVVAMVLIFIAGLALPEAFGEHGLLFASTYAGVRVLHLVLYADASRRGRASWSAITGFAVTVLVGMALLVGGSFLEGGHRVATWALAAAIDYAGPAWLTRERLRGLQPVAVAHFAERYSLFIIICLGESILAIAVGVNAAHLGRGSLGVAALALLMTVGLWWTYFDRFAATAEERLRHHREPVLAAADAYSYLHLLLVAGIIVFAVGAKATLAHVDRPLEAGPRLALCGGVALYLIGHVAFQRRLLGTLVHEELVAAGAACALGVLGTHLPAWSIALGLTLLLAALVALASFPSSFTVRPSRRAP